MVNKVEKIIERYGRARANGDQWKSFFDEAYEYIFPNRDVRDMVVPGERKNRQVYDNTPTIAAKRYISKLHTGLTPLYSQWASLIPNKEVPTEIEGDITEILQGITKQIFQFIDESNFHLVINEAYHDLVMGTGIFLCLETGDIEAPFTFRYTPLQHVFLDPTETGDVKTVFREFRELPVQDIMTLWPIEDTILPQGLKNMLEQRPTEKIQLIEGTIYDPKKDEYEYFVLYEKEKTILYSQVSESSPWIVFRWSKRAGEVYGRGIGLDALPTIRTLNKMVEFELKATELLAYPIYMTFRDGIFDPWTVKIRPNINIPVSPGAGNNPPIIPLPQAGNIQYSQLQVQDFRSQINTMFFSDNLGDPVESSKMTATEVNIRHQQVLEEQTPSLGRLITELINKIMDRILFILRKEGLVPKVLTLKDRRIKLDYQSPLAQVEGIQNINKLSQAGQVFQSLLGPQIAMFMFDIPKLAEWVPKQLNAPIEPFASAKKIKELVTNMQNQMQQQQQQPQGALPSAQSAQPLPAQQQ